MFSHSGNRAFKFLMGIWVQLVEIAEHNETINVSFQYLFAP